MLSQSLFCRVSVMPGLLAARVHSKLTKDYQRFRLCVREITIYQVQRANKIWRSQFTDVFGKKQCLFSCATNPHRTAFLSQLSRIFSQWKALGINTLHTSSTKLSIVFASAVLLTASAQEKMADADKDKEIIDKAEELYEKQELRELYTFLSEHKESKNPEVLWRLARACRRLSQISSTAEKKALTYEGLKFAKQGIEADENSGFCQKWTGIMLSEVGDYEGTKKKLEDSYLIQSHFLKAMELCPTDATARYLMGRWCYTFAELPWYQRKIAEALFGKPPTSTYEEALKYFEEAEKLSPGFYSSNLLMIGKCYLGLKKKDEAKLWFQKAAEYKGETEDDKKAVEEAKSHLK